MSSKSVLLLGIVFIFLLNVVAVHNYIDNYYYQSEDTNLTKIELSPEAVVLEKLSAEHKQKDKKVVKEEVKKQKDIDEELLRYKSHYQSEIEQEKKSWNKLFTAKKEKKKKQQIKEQKTGKKEVAEDAIITLNLNLNNKFIPNNPIIKKMSQKLDSKKIIKIKIYKYSIKLKDYLEKIKYDFAENGVDIDDIKVIYNKDENKKNKIKILLVKKD